MSTSFDARICRVSLSFVLALVVFPGCVDAGEGTEVPDSSAGAGAVGGAVASGGAGGATAGSGGVAGSTAGMTASGGAGGSLGGTAGTGGPLAGTGGVGGTGGSGGALGGAGSGGALGGAGSGGALGGAGAGGTAGGGGTAGASAGSANGGAAGFTAAVDRTTAWNDPDYGCGNCHGDEGEGIVNRGPEIRHPNRVLFDYMVRTGDAMPLPAYRDPMKPVTTAMISDAILDDIYEWLSAFPKPTTGAELFADYCSYCHGADGRGGPNQGYASASHSAPFEDTGASFLKHVRDGHIRSGAGGDIDVSDRQEWMPPFPTTVLTDAEVALIEAWLPKN